MSSNTEKQKTTQKTEDGEEVEEKIQALDEGDIAILKTYVRIQ